MNDPLSNFAFRCDLRHYNLVFGKVMTGLDVVRKIEALNGRGLH
jgi:cyclophilin family peptidyl-prolyl cis-trans isomerase